MTIHGQTMSLPVPPQKVGVTLVPPRPPLKAAASMMFERMVRRERNELLHLVRITRPELPARRRQVSTGLSWSRGSQRELGRKLKSN